VVFGNGSGKIDVGTVDPIYTIGGRRYATYLPAMTGVKEETAGIIFMENGKCKMENKKGECERYEYVLDLKEADEGSDLWLFAKTADLKDNFEKMAVLLSPGFDGRAWYEKDSEHLQLKIFAAPAPYSLPSTPSYEVSYRLTAPRFDAAEWSNISQSDSPGFIMSE
jgi:hypothetical protein